MCIIIIIIISIIIIYTFINAIDWKKWEHIFNRSVFHNIF